MRPLGVVVRRDDLEQTVAIGDWTSRISAVLVVIGCLVPLVLLAAIALGRRGARSAPAAKSGRDEEAR